MTDLLRVTQNDVETLLICTLRYSLGRMSYMPSLIQDIFYKHEDSVGTIFIAQVVREVRKEIARNPLLCNLTDWEKFADRLAKKFRL